MTGFIPFVSRKPSRWLLMAPILMNLLTYYQYQYSIGFQYSFGVSAFLIYAMLINIPDLHAPSKKVLVTIGVVASCCFYLTASLPKVEYYFNRWEENSDDFITMEQALDELPEDASLNVSTYLLSHVADRSEVYQAKYGDLYHGDKPDVDYVVAGIGSAGTATGLGMGFRKYSSKAKVIGVEPAGSPMITEGRSAPHKIQGIGANFIPENLDMDYIEDVMTVTDDESIEFTRRLVREEGIFAGISSGAAVAAAVKLASEKKGSKIVVILPDRGDRYLSTGIFE